MNEWQNPHFLCTFSLFLLSVEHWHSQLSPVFRTRSWLLADPHTAVCGNTGIHLQVQGSTFIRQSKICVKTFPWEHVEESKSNSYLNESSKWKSGWKLKMEIRVEALNGNLSEIFKGTFAPVRVWLKVIWLERAKIGEYPLMVLTLFCCVFDFN
jgi:hypothetical protein